MNTIFKRTHKQEVESQKRDAYMTRYDKLNKIGFEEAWLEATRNDAGLPEISSNESFTEREQILVRAIIGLARRVQELTYEWS